LMSDPGRLTAMAASARRIGRPRAAHAIARDRLTLAGVGAALTDEHRSSAGPGDKDFVQLTEAT